VTIYLLDTNVVSELRRPHPGPAVVAWLAAIETTRLRLSAVTLGEIQRGIESLRERDPAKAAEIESWADELERAHELIAADAAVFRRCARLMHRHPAPAWEDALIAATALVHGLTVATRNVRDFEGLGPPVCDPFRRDSVG
jgi:hypothetical protein